MKLAIVGCRHCEDYEYVKWAVHFFLDHFPKSSDGRSILITEIVSGGAAGADTLAEDYADEFHIPKHVFPAEWDKYGKSAGYRRNIQIVDYADMILAFWDNKSKGTKHTIDLARKTGKPCFIFSGWKGK